MTTPTHIPPAMRGEGVPEWIVEVFPREWERNPPFIFCSLDWKWYRFPSGRGIIDPRYARAATDYEIDNRLTYRQTVFATPTEITAARDGGRGDGR